MNDNGCISEEFWKDLQKGGPLHSFLRKVEDKENGLRIEYRGDAKPYETVTIYYDRHIIWRISKQCNIYKVEMSAKNARGENKRRLLEALGNDPFNFITLSQHAQHYPFVRNTSFDEDFVDRTYDLMLKEVKRLYGDKSKNPAHCFA